MSASPTDPPAAAPSARARSTAAPALVALVGNPNTGKTTLFNALTGHHRHTANYPGVTVELGRARVLAANRPIELLDLPGAYSLAAVSPDELVAANVICGQRRELPRPDAIVAIVDASNLHRNLYLVSQLLDADRPLVVALNMSDVAAARGFRIDASALAARLGVAVVPIVATDSKTLPPLVRAIESALAAPQRTPAPPLPPDLLSEAAQVATRSGLLALPQALRVLLDRGGFAEQQFVHEGGDRAALAAARTRLSAASVDGPAVEVRARYAWIAGVLDGAVERPRGDRRAPGALLDRILMHRALGPLILLAVLATLFQAIFAWADPLMRLIDEELFGRLAIAAARVIPEGAMQSLVVDGAIAGVGGVLVFLPQIMILFALIAVLEDCGYMARAAFMMDRVMQFAGLSGRAFIPLLSSFACAVPAIMGTRVIADRRERFVTILIAPFMSCAARLPVYVLMIGAFVPAHTYLGGWIGLHGLVMLAAYLVGAVVALPIAWLLKRTAFRGPNPGFLLELPNYQWPRVRTVALRVHLAAREFVVRAGTVILAVNLVVWALAYFPRSDAAAEAVDRAAAAHGWDAPQRDAELEGAYLRDSYLGRAGRWIEPVVAPLGWDWRIGMAVLASFPAREVVVGALGTIFNLGGDVTEESQELRAALQRATHPDGRPLFTLPVALSIMVFFALCAQCVSTLVIIGRETRSWRWPIVSFVGMTTIAYLAAWGVAALARAAGADGT
ncbi:MAG: ferrous iron transport protein B [Phycisphaerae bacterium]